MFLSPVNDLCQGAWSLTGHNLNDPTLPIEKGTGNATGRTDAWMKICGGKLQIDLVCAAGATQHCTVRQTISIPSGSGRVHVRKSCHGKSGNLCCHQCWTIGD